MSYRRYDSRDGSNSQVVGFLSGCVAGLVIGGAIGLLMAPHRGDITRRKIARRAEETKDQVVEKVEDLMVHRREDVDDDVDEEARS